MKEKLSFSIPSKSKSKPKQTSEQEEDSNSKHYLTEFDPSKSLESQNKKTLIIAPIENEYRPHKKMKNIDLPLHQDDSTDIHFEVETLTSDPATDSMSYGLNVRQSITDPTQLQSQQQLETRTEDVLLEKLRHDLKRLPEDRGFEEFEEMPVEDFAQALLKGYGWHEGRGIGRRAKEDVKVKQYTKRTDKEGLGFIAASHDSRSSKRSSNVSNNGNDSVSLRDKEKPKEREENQEGFSVGKQVRVISGKKENLGLKGTVVEILGSDSILLRVDKSGEKVNVRGYDVAELGSREEVKFLKEFKELKIEEENKSSNRDEEHKHVNKRGVESKESVKHGNGGNGKERRVQWLRSHIRVRIISKDFKGGRLFRKKGEVVDVVGPYMCDISMDEGRELVQNVDQDHLETALPRKGGPVLVLYGKHKGVYGNLVERDLNREVGVVQDSDSRELLSVKLEQIAEFVGDPSYIGY